MEEEIMNNKESIKYANMAIFSAVMAYEPKEVKALFNLASQRAGLRIGVDIMDRTKESYENLKKLILMHFPEDHKMHEHQVVDSYIMITLYCFLGGKNSEKGLEMFIKNTFGHN